MDTITFGQTNNYVTKLQQWLNMHGYRQIITGYFGVITRNSIRKYQTDNELTVTGAVDAALFALITAPDNLDKWCAAIQSMEGFYSPGENQQYPNGTPAWINNNPGNLKWCGQQNATQNGAFAKFATYQDGYNALKNLLIRACTGQTSIYNPDGTLVDFYDIYAPASDSNDPTHYASVVATALGVQPTCIIKTLLPQ